VLAISLVLFLFWNVSIKSRLEGTHDYPTPLAVEKGYYGTVWKMYIEAEDPHWGYGQNRCNSRSPGWGPYFSDTILISQRIHIIWKDFFNGIL